MMYRGLSLFLLVTVAVEFAVAKKLPSYFQPCKQSDPNYEQCTIQSIEKIRPYLAKGISKLKVPPLEPLVIPLLQVNRDQENIKLKATFKDLTTYGGSNFIINSIRPNFEKNSVEGRLTLPLIHTETDYDVDGRVLLIPVKGKGHFMGNITDVVVDYKGSGDTATNSKGVKHMVIKNIKIKVKVNGEPSIQLTNTDGNNNNKVLTNTAFNFYNQNKRQVLEVVGPIIEETAEQFAIQLGNQILQGIPYDELVPK